MRKSILTLAPLALAAAVGSAFADESSVTLYGVLDVGVAQIAHSASFDNNFVTGANPTNAVKASPTGQAASSATGMMNGGMSASRWGIRGQEDMGGGLKTVFQLESAINVPNGGISNAALSMATNSALGPNASADSAISGQLFARAAWVGFASSDWGTLTFGRQQSFFLDNIAVFDPMSGAQMFAPIGFAGSYGGGGFTDDSRVDNSVKYKVNIDKFTLGALYKFGGVSGNTQAQGAMQLNLVYSAGPFAFQAGYQYFKDAFSISNGYTTRTIVTGVTPTLVGGVVTGVTTTTASVPFAGIAATAADTRAYMLSMKYNITPATALKFGYERESFGNPSNPGADKAVTQLYGQVLTGPANVTAFASQKILNVYWLGAAYDVNKSWSVAGGLYHVLQNSYATGAVAGCATNVNAACSGKLDYDSVMADYRFSKRTDAYAAFMISRVTGGPSAGYFDSVNHIVGVGMRHVF